MLKILDKYILKGFLPLLLMTFLICWFILLMQFLWKYVDDLVGKGLSVWIVGQTVFYAAMSLIPLALPLGILLASLMFFGQIGERLELLAMKASGMPLYRIMAPLFVTVALLAGGLLYFQNTYMITSQVRMWTLIYSARYATPELEIPERTFYNGITGYSIYVGQRDPLHQGRMHDIMLYDHKEGNEKTRIIRADSGRIVMDDGQKYLTWRLYNGQSFENMGRPNSPSDPQPTAYAKERFSYKEIVILFDASFNLQDESEMSSRFVGKNLAQLEYAIDTSTLVIDSLRGSSAKQLAEMQDRLSYTYNLPSRFDTTQVAVVERTKLLGSDTLTTRIHIDSLLLRSSIHDSLSVVRNALSSLQQMRNESESRLYVDKDAYFNYRTNRQEWHRKFTFPVACLVFFFIGAPLGAIIRKGGIGVPIIVSVGFFVIYYIIDTLGQNLIRSESLDVVTGMWLSTYVLLPIGAWLTWQATRDSASLNTEAYMVFFRRLLGTARVRKIDYQEVALERVDYSKVDGLLYKLKKSLGTLSQDPWINKVLDKRKLLLEQWVYHPSEQMMGEAYQQVEELVSELSRSTKRMEVAKIQDMPILMMRLVPYVLPKNHYVLWGLRALNLLLPISILLIWLLSSRRATSHKDIQTALRLVDELIEQREQDKALERIESKGL